MGVNVVVRVGENAVNVGVSVFIIGIEVGGRVAVCIWGDSIRINGVDEASGVGIPVQPANRKMRRTANR